MSEVPLAASDLLVTEATSELPYEYSLVLLGTMAVVIVARTVFLGRRQVDRQLTLALAWWFLAALLRESWLQQILMTHTVLSLGDIRLMTHTAALCAAIPCFLMVRSWAYLEKFGPRIILTMYVGLAALLSVMAWVSSSSRRADIAIEELEDWHTALYHVLYATPMPIAFVFVIAGCIRVLLTERTRRNVAITSIAIVSCTIAGVDHLTRGLSAVMLAVGWENWLTEARSEANDLLFLPSITLVSLLAAMPVIPAIRARLNNDPSSRAAKRLEQMWRVLTTAIPEVTLDSTEGSVGIEREHRMRIECEDALLQLLPWMPATGLETERSPSDRAEAVGDALARYQQSAHPDHRNSVHAPPRWHTDEEELLRVADAWTTNRGD